MQEIEETLRTLLSEQTESWSTELCKGSLKESLKEHYQSSRVEQESSFRSEFEEIISKQFVPRMLDDSIAALQEQKLFSMEILSLIRAESKGQLEKRKARFFSLPQISRRSISVFKAMSFLGILSALLFGLGMWSEFERIFLVVNVCLLLFGFGALLVAQNKGAAQKQNAWNRKLFLWLSRSEQDDDEWLIHVQKAMQSFLEELANHVVSVIALTTQLVLSQQASLQMQEKIREAEEAEASRESSEEGSELIEVLTNEEIEVRFENRSLQSVVQGCLDGFSEVYYSDLKREPERALDACIKLMSDLESSGIGLKTLEKGSAFEKEMEKNFVIRGRLEEEDSVMMIHPAFLYKGEVLSKGTIKRERKRRS